MTKMLNGLKFLLEVPILFVVLLFKYLRVFWAIKIHSYYSESIDAHKKSPKPFPLKKKTLSFPP